MDVNKAMTKTCPIMTKPIAQGMGGDSTFIQQDMPITWYQNCMALDCMAWEISLDGHGQELPMDGYCKLMEKQDEPIY